MAAFENDPKKNPLNKLRRFPAGEKKNQKNKGNWARRRRAPRQRAKNEEKWARRRRAPRQKGQKMEKMARAEKNEKNGARRRRAPDFFWGFYYVFLGFFLEKFFFWNPFKKMKIIF